MWTNKRKNSKKCLKKQKNDYNYKKEYKKRKDAIYMKKNIITLETLKEGVESLG
jgi:hypothetical protein